VSIAAIFVNYRTAELSVRAVAALLLELQALGEHHVYVVDNGNARRADT
jgi:GT2 family glycosyltransferase